MNGWPINNPFGAVAQVYTNLGYLGHPGVDWPCSVGTDVHAMADGTIIFTGDAGTAGLMVVIEHSFGITRYLHLSMARAEGGFVTAGTWIGKSGASGLVRGPHLHVDLSPEGEGEDNGFGGRVNPEPYMVTV